MEERTDDVEQRDAGIKNLGLLEIRVYRTEAETTEERRTLRATGSSPIPPGQIYEKDLKGKETGYFTAFGSERIESRGRKVIAKYIDDLENPFVTFKFRYSSKRSCSRQQAILTGS